PRARAVGQRRTVVPDAAFARRSASVAAGRRRDGAVPWWHRPPLARPGLNSAQGAPEFRRNIYVQWQAQDPSAPSPPPAGPAPAPAAPNVPAGWYPDPWMIAQSRFWDGHAWTPHVSGTFAPVRVITAPAQPQLPSVDGGGGVAILA